MLFRFVGSADSMIVPNRSACAWMLTLRFNALLPAVPSTTWPLTVAVDVQLFAADAPRKVPGGVTCTVKLKVEPLVKVPTEQVTCVAVVVKHPPEEVSGPRLKPLAPS